MFDGSPSCVFVVDASGCICYANRAFCTATRASDEQLKGVCIEELGRARGGPIWVAIESAAPWQGELSFTVDDRTCAGIVAVTPITDTAGVCQLVLCTSDALAEPAPESGRITPASPMVLVADLDGTIVFVDRTVPGVSREDAIGQSIYEFIPAEQHERIRAYVAEVITTKGSLSYELTGMGAYGSTSTFKVHVGPIVRGDDVFALSFVSWEAAPPEEDVEARYRVLADAGMEGLVIHERNTIIDANRTVYDMFGYTAAELIGQPVTKLFAARSRGTVLQPSFYQSGTLHEVDGVRSDGTTIAIEVCGKSLPHASGLSTVIAIRNIVSRRRAGRTRAAARTKRASAESGRGPIELSERELDVLELLAQGMTNREVSERIQVSARTVDHHVSHILGKLGVPNRTAAAMAARRRGLLR